MENQGKNHRHPGAGQRLQPATEKKSLPASLYKREGIRGQGRGEWFKGGVNGGNAGMKGEG
jgi:hypothetical protein